MSIKLKATVGANGCPCTAQCGADRNAIPADVPRSRTNIQRQQSILDEALLFID
ncbi:hypothetical protein [Bradyrhizobium uaiense]|uniref:hypothetical protein n=1 Tax=Bradyrhizobium uaiense TaxID=2594946 RepID=UPI0013D49E9A|nr:hypothetical protein [Bradyrhizobium uaiense]